MKILRFLISLSITISLAYLLSNPMSIGENTLPPLGHFLNPFEGFWNNAESDLPQFDDEVYLEGLKAPVTIKYDSSLVPHIIAENDHDLYMAQGYVMASLRLWQMEFVSHAAAGRICELVGEKALQLDRISRREGMVTGAKVNLEFINKDPKIKSFIEAYTSGVNQYINSLSYKTYPLEYKLIGYAPEPWTPLKTALIQEYMIKELTGTDSDLENTNFVKLFDKETFDLLFPDFPEGIDPTIPTDPDSLWGFEKLSHPAKQGQPVLSSTPKTYPQPDPDNGSNNWAVHGSKTKNGHPILCSDTHLGLSLPSLWLVVQLQTPDQNVMGFVLPGSFGITAGFNNHVAWGFTNAPRDTRDWYSIRFKNSKKHEYFYDSAWRPTTVKIEEIKIKGAESFYDTVYYTHYGPVVYDDNFMPTNGKNGYALKWIGHEPSRIIHAISGLNRAKNYDDYLSAIQNWDAPPQNAAFASTEGDIALTVQGSFPLKWKEQGKFLLDGADPSNEWGVKIPKSHSAAMYNPKRGYVSSANQHSVDSLYPYYYYNDFNEYYRNRRINRLLTEMDQITSEDMIRMQNDSYNINAEELLPIMLENIEESQLNQQQQNYLNQLKDWNYDYKAEELAPALFEMWWGELYYAIWDECFSDSIALNTPEDYNTYLLMRDKPDLSFFDILSTSKVETLNDLIRFTFNSTTKYVDRLLKQDPDYKWWNYKGTSIIHLAQIDALSELELMVDGHANAINSIKYNHGPSQRFVVEMTSPPTGYFTYPGGQSGNPGSQYYTNMLEEWRTGKMRPMVLMQPDKEYADQIVFTQTLNPKK